MTKLRRPLTPYRALSRIADLLGWDGCGDVIGKSEWSVRKFSDPDTGREISLQDAIRLDAAYQRAGGTGAPLLECYSARLELELADDADRQRCLIDATSRAAKEVGEAIAATLDAASRANDPAAHLRAVTEAKEGLESMQALVTNLERGNIHER
ncbi:hypothetical protein OVA07_14115 [Novosphingobium sp. SL115]|uniref:hypothetical protein n=1 Tax=Novosphingobium sp. SL115 TaxID=2995150 RepID=UPI002276CAE0|nr:hypothetical protein [Novosphingobium sp. SL115]MCY1672139.1 hypothetical protein [Novosphingobium sp. SL115]